MGALAGVTAAAAVAAATCSSPSAPRTAAGRPLGAPAAAAPRRAASVAPHARIDPGAIVADVARLCAPEFAGRGSYQPGGRAAAEWVAARFAEAGLDVVRQPIGDGAINVVGVRRAGPRAVVVSAHYDHLGVGPDGTVYPGADDNASGVAVMLAVMRAVADRPSRRTLVFIAFGAEEPGLRGSRAYVDDPVWPLDATELVVNFDMVGRNLFEWLGSGRPRAVGVVGIEADARARRLVMAAARAERLQVVAGTARMLAWLGMDRRTDDWWFRQRGVATIHLSTGLHRDYHEPTDTPDRLRPDQMVRIARLATRVVADVAGVR